MALFEPKFIEHFLGMDQERCLAKHHPCHGTVPTCWSACTGSMGGPAIWASLEREKAQTPKPTRDGSCWPPSLTEIDNDGPKVAKTALTIGPIMTV